VEPVASQILAKLRCLAAALRKRHAFTINKVKRPKISLMHVSVATEWNHTKV